MKYRQLSKVNVSQHLEDCVLNSNCSAGFFILIRNETESTRESRPKISDMRVHIQREPEVYLQFKKFLIYMYIYIPPYF